MVLNTVNKMDTVAPAGVAWLGIFPQTKRSLIDSRPGPMSGLQVRSPVGVHMESNQPMFLIHIDVFLPPFSSF